MKAAQAMVKQKQAELMRLAAKAAEKATVPMNTPPHIRDVLNDLLRDALDTLRKERDTGKPPRQRYHVTKDELDPETGLMFNLDVNCMNADGIFAGQQAVNNISASVAWPKMHGDADRFMRALADREAHDKANRMSIPDVERVLDVNPGTLKRCSTEMVELGFIDSVRNKGPAGGVWLTDRGRAFLRLLTPNR
ncbi:MAG: hypothetical protein ABSH22_21495 [Tepidisphaeraceae bacterium]